MRPRKIVWWMEAYLEALVRFYPTIYLRELQEILANDFQLGPHEAPSIAAIARLFTKLKITRKKCVHVPKERMSPHNRYCRQFYFQWRRTIDPDRVYYFDEVILTLKLMSAITGEQIQGWHVHRSGRKAELGLVNILRWLFVDSLKE